MNEIITKLKFDDSDLEFFRQSETWSEEDKKYVRQIYLLMINGMPVSGCTIFEFDGCRFIFNTFTVKTDRNKGYAGEVIKKVCHDSKGYLVLARSVNPHVINLFQKLGFKTLNRNSSSIEVLGNCELL
ncbi:MAG: GNAT family N-acetyltransferase [Candidatus Paceibacterota bacterium]|jgi:predicted GNAT family acetyltransferase